MVKYLAGLKRKKGFTLVELVVVIAIIAVLMTIGMMSMLDERAEKLILANSNAQSLFTATQLAFTRMQFTERGLVDYDAGDEKYITYNAGQKMTAGKYLFLELEATEQGLQYVHVDYTINGLMARPDKTMTKLEKYILNALNTGIADAYNGYFYAQVDENFRVICTHFSDYRLPTYVSNPSAYRTSLTFTEAGRINHITVGTYCDVDVFDAGKGDYLFNAPSSTKYFAGISEAPAT